MKDLNLREYAMFLPLLVLVLWIGIYPSTFRNVFAPTVEKILADFHSEAHEGTHG